VVKKQSRPFSWVNPFKAKAARAAKKKARAAEYVPADVDKAEAEQRDALARMEAAESLAHAGDHSYMPLPNEGTFRRAPVRYDE